MELNDLLRMVDVDPGTALVLRHRPSEPAFRKALALLPGGRIDLFEAYQSYQGEQAELSFIKRLGGTLVSFIEHDVGKAVFVGLYHVRDAKLITREEFWAMPAQQELKALGNPGWTSDEKREKRYHFDLERMPHHEDWRGRLIIEWPPVRSWIRRADTTPLRVLAIHEESLFDGALVPWDEIDFRWSELAILPGRMRAALEQWRGIYLIQDSSDGRCYVGSAGGSTNLLGRWLNYASTGHGGNRLLRGRDPSTFRFSILQRLSPDLPPEDVVRIENSWKLRLHTRGLFGLNEN